MSASDFNKYMPVDLDDQIPYAPSFRWREALWQREWDVFLYPTQTIYQNILKMAQKMEAIRGRLCKPVTVTSWLRCPAYNEKINGRHFSKHLIGLACDFTVLTYTPDQVRALLLPELQRLGLRMEDNPGSSWVHVDMGEVGPGGRFFKV